jgi:hypothetical protein
MPFSTPDFASLIPAIAGHVGAMPTESERPIEHYRLDANGYWNLLRYFDRKTADGYPWARDRHAIRTIAAHFNEQTLGKALCESDTWLSTSDINTRFSRLLADPFGQPTYRLFPELNQTTNTDQWRRQCLDILWQLRHSIVHNAGVLTRSDAAKLRLLTKATVESPRVLEITNGDVWYVKLFLDDLVAWVNAKIALRLSEVMTTLHQGDAALFQPAVTAQELAQTLREPVTIAGSQAVPT